MADESASEFVRRKINEEKKPFLITEEACKELDEKVSPILEKLGIRYSGFRWREAGRYGGENGACEVVFRGIDNLGLYIDNSKVWVFDVVSSDLPVGILVSKSKANDISVVDSGVGEAFFGGGFIGKLNLYVCDVDEMVLEDANIKNTKRIRHREED